MDPTDLDDDWRRHAACLGATAKFFRPDQPRGERKPWSPIDAQRICATCPVALECLTYAVDANEHFGIWGGAGGDLLRGLRRLRNRVAADHADAGECDCEWCQAVDAHLSRIRELIVTEVPRPKRAPHRNGPAVTHGKASTYARGDRCSRCKFRVSAAGTRLHEAGIDVPAWWDQHFGIRHGYSDQPKRTARECAAARELVVHQIAVAINERLGILGRDVAWLAEQLSHVCAPDIARQLCSLDDPAHLVTPTQMAAVTTVLGVDAATLLTGQSKAAA